MKVEEVEPRLAAFVADTHKDATLNNVVESDGHAGLTFLFEIVDRENGREDYVIKMPPKGVRYRGNTDVYRQAPLLRQLASAELPVPEVPWAYEDNPWFETPFIIMRRLPGDVFFVWDPVAAFSRAPADTRAVWEQCLALLPQIHQIDWRTQLRDWDEPEPLDTNINRWQKIYEQAPESEWIAHAARLHAMLIESTPDDTPIGLFHGDYQPGNVLYSGGQLTGVIDWELAGIGDQLLDVGWLMMVCDPHNWVDDGWRPIGAPSPDHVLARYEQGMGRHYPAAQWYQAFAGYRLASIGCLNVKLHRNGQRHDPVWEKIGQSIVPMFERAEALLHTLS